MVDYVHRFNQQIGDHSTNSSISQNMYLIELMLYGAAKKLGDVDFTTFKDSDLKNTLYEIFEYESEEMSSDYSEYCPNIHNPIYEINVLAGLTNGVESIKPKRTKKRSFF